MSEEFLAMLDGYILLMRRTKRTLFELKNYIVLEVQMHLLSRAVYQKQLRSTSANRKYVGMVHRSSKASVSCLREETPKH